MKRARKLSILREKKRNNILKYSLKLFAKYSYYRTTMDLIAQKCGISKGLIYTYFKSKEEILRVLFKEGIKKILQSIENFQEVKNEEQFAALVRSLINVIIKNKDFFTLYFSLFNEEILSKNFRKQIKEDFSVLYEIFENYYKNKGVFEPDIMAYTLVSSIDGLIVDYITFRDLPIQSMAEVLIQKFK